MNTEKQELDNLVIALGDSMNTFLLAKLAHERAAQDFKRAQKAVGEIEDRIRAFKWGERSLEPLKV